ncbi:MAG: sugar phosphate isomerase/epimerase, partial [Actinobacteria bacterium]|nr:sugar phosphate isomerase/epimerase [Actinomycetota bacterium]
KAGGRFLVVHPGDFCQTEEERSIRLGFSINSLDEILPYAEKNGVCIAIENMPNSFLGDSPEELLYIIGQVRKKISNKGAIGICFDSGHAFLTKTIDIYLNKYLSDIIGMHIHDNFGDINMDYRYAPDDKHLPPGKGCIDWASFIKKVKKSYKGAFVFEIMPWQNSNNIISLLGDIKSFIKKFCL